MEKEKRCRVLCIFIALGSGFICLGQQNNYTFKNNSFVEIKVSGWFAQTIDKVYKAEGVDKSSGSFGVPLKALPVPDFQIILQPKETEVISGQEDQVPQEDCLGYLVAEYRVIPSLPLPRAVGSSSPVDLYLVGRRFWAHTLPGLCGTNTIELNYNPATYLKFTIKINDVEDYFDDVPKVN